MFKRFRPERNEGRIITVDMNHERPVEKMNCLGCGKLVERLWKCDELCEECYDEWSVESAKHWVAERFGF